ncbi:MAG: prephenate dehydrogenase/arogenate dehydrogenase family protein [Promethearchaeati archaeon]
MLGKSITIIGGSGGIGQVFATFFKTHGFNVTIFARNKEKLEEVANTLDVNFDLDLERSIKGADIVMVSIPIRSTPQLIRQVGPLLKRDALIFDVTSLKKETYKALNETRKNYEVNSVSLHPMFGPGIKSMENYNMILLNVGGTDNYNKKKDALKKMFIKEGLYLTEINDPEEHDKMMAIVLGTPHMFNILFMKLLKTMDIPLSKLMDFTGTTFLLQKVFAESIIQREVEMFGEIQMDNPQFHTLLEEFKKVLKEYSSIIENKNLKKFKKIFSDGIEYSINDPHFEQSYRFFYEFMKILKKT